MVKSSVLFLLFFICLFAAVSAQNSVCEQNSLHNAAEKGQISQVMCLLKNGSDVNTRDSYGRTPLHLAAANGHQQTAKVLIEAGADINAEDNKGHTPLYEAKANSHSAMSEYLVSKGAEKLPILKPSLKFKTLEEFERQINQPAVLLDSKYVCFFAPKEKLREAKIVFSYLVKAYDKLHTIIGVNTEYKMVVYAFPKGNPHGWGGTSNCSIEYDDTNLNLDDQEEWQKYKKPHISGYVEEMAHSFVHATKAQFGWEMIGWSLGAKVTEKIAGNPIHRSQIQKTRQKQKKTFQRYVRNQYVFPKNLPANQCDRIHAWILWQCELKYGSDFWADFFKEIRKEKESLKKAGKSEGRDARYRITVECFDRLPNLDFKNMLRKYQISLTVDVKSLNPESPNWNRRLTN